MTGDSTSLASEIERLRRHTAELEREVAELQPYRYRFQRLLETGFIGIAIADERGHFREINDALLSMLGYSREDFSAGRIRWMELTPPEYRERDQQALQEILQRGECTPFEKEFITGSGQRLPVLIWMSLHDTQPPMSVLSIVLNQTERKQMEQEHEKLRLRLIAEQEERLRVQESLLRELSTPLIPISNSVMVMPLIGSVDSRRALLVLETLLDGVAAKRVKVVILDITGVPVVDTHVAGAIDRAARAVALLGARMIITGIRPEVAQTLIMLQAPLDGMVPCGSLQDGIRLALGWEQAGYALAGGRQDRPGADR